MKRKAGGGRKEDGQTDKQKRRNFAQAIGEAPMQPYISMTISPKMARQLKRSASAARPPSA
jgi:hypothetical protein